MLLIARTGSEPVTTDDLRAAPYYVRKILEDAAVVSVDVLTRVEADNGAAANVLTSYSLVPDEVTV